VKPGNRVEEKTVMTSDTSFWGIVLTSGGTPKASVVAKGRSFEEVF